jgi:uncharacterized low-complexity protein
MNVKALAALVGTLSLGSLAAGCATTSTAAPTTEKASEAACGGEKAAPATEKASEASCGGQKATSTPEKASEHSCGAAGCGGAAPKN